MGEITLTIDGKEIKGESGGTILDVCQKNDIDVPTLCHFDGLSDIGSCRMCIVEIEGPKGTTIDTACTTPAINGMVVKTNTEKLMDMRKATLELLFAEGNHYCMYCVASGNCELQDLAYKFGIEHIRWQVRQPRREIDATHKYLVMDYDRCILCYRCVRACEELVGNGTLGVDGRGFGAKIVADHKIPWGESSCVSAGSCMQVCPTGAISDRKNAYVGQEKHVDRIKSTCLFCSVGCSTELLVRSNHILKIEGDWEAEPNKGLLCSMGRFEPLYEEKRKRALKPLVKYNGTLKEASWEDSMDLLARRLKNFDKESMGALISTRATNETMKLFSDLFKGMGIENIGCLDKNIQKSSEDKINLAELDEADMFIVVGEDLVENHQVVGFFVKRGVTQRWSFLLVIDEKESDLVQIANRWLKPDEVDEAIHLCNAASKPVVIYGEQAGDELEKLRQELGDKAKFFWMPPGTNSRGALNVGLNGNFDADSAKCVYIMACDQGKISGDTLAELRKADLVVVQSSYIEPWGDIADFILPTVTWAEKEGSVTNMEGRISNVSKAVQPPAGVKNEGEVLNLLMNKLAVRV
jgi:formate dehydrogenase major subunit